nr:WAT1-related protein [Ipomoea batatas]
MLIVETLNRSFRSLINQTLADLTVLDAAPNPPPVSIDSLLKPIGVISKPILLVASPGDGLAGALVTRQHAPTRPAIESSMMKTPRAITGLSRKRSHSVLACLDSHIPPPMIGIEIMNGRRKEVAERNAWGGEWCSV